MSRWLFLRGWTREARHWGEFPAQFRAAIADAQIEAPDLPGNGRLWQRPSPLSVGAMVDELRAARKGAPYHLLGLSLGALAAIDWASRYPGEVAACVLINTSLSPYSAFYHRLRPANYARLLHLFALERDVRAREGAILALTSAQGADGELIATWTGYAREQPVSRGNALRQLVAAMRYRAPAAAPPVPILVLASGADRLVDPRCSSSIARRWNAPLAVHPSAGHDLALDDGPWLAARVSDWLKRI